GEVGPNFIAVEQGRRRGVLRAPGVAGGEPETLNGVGVSGEGKLVKGSQGIKVGAFIVFPGQIPVFRPAVQDQAAMGERTGPAQADGTVESYIPAVKR